MTTPLCVTSSPQYILDWRYNMLINIIFFNYWKLQIKTNIQMTKSSKRDMSLFYMTRSYTGSSDLYRLLCPSAGLSVCMYICPWLKCNFPINHLVHQTVVKFSEKAWKLCFQRFSSFHIIYRLTKDFETFSLFVAHDLLYHLLIINVMQWK